MSDTQETAYDRFERLASEFHAETGIMRPGKNDVTGQYSPEYREGAFSAWLMMRNKSQRATLGSEEEPLRELHCQRCHREHTVWFAPNALWNRVARDDEQFLCMDCFAILAEERGVNPSAWMLVEEDVDLSDALEHVRKLSTPVSLGSAEIPEGVREYMKQHGHCDSATPGQEEWLVIFKRDTGPIVAIPFRSYEVAADYFKRVQEQWSDAYLCKVQNGPGRPLLTPARARREDTP